MQTGRAPISVAELAARDFKMRTLSTKLQSLYNLDDFGLINVLCIGFALCTYDVILTYSVFDHK